MISKRLSFVQQRHLLLRPRHRRRICHLDVRRLESGGCSAKVNATVVCFARRQIHLDLRCSEHQDARACSLAIIGAYAGPLRLRRAHGTANEHPPHRPAASSARRSRFSSSSGVGHKSACPTSSPMPVTWPPSSPSRPVPASPSSRPTSATPLPCATPSPARGARSRHAPRGVSGAIRKRPLSGTRRLRRNVLAPVGNRLLTVECAFAICSMWRFTVPCDLTLLISTGVSAS